MSRSDLIKRYDTLLAPYAVQNAGEHGRTHRENEHPAKLPFQRDRDRIVHSRAFRRLKHKTQVIISPKDDHVRDRLTHSLEGSQIARSLCRALQLNEDLAEATILAHDLGHPPFGHQGQDVLNELISPLGYSFDHNEHGYRIVTKLEHSYPDFPGLNLTFETLNGMRKHHTPWEMPEAKMPHRASLEAQLVNLADEIAYYSHDVDDGLRAGLIPLELFSQTALGNDAIELVKKRYPNLETTLPVWHPQLIRSLIHLLITDIVTNTSKNIEILKIKTVQDIYNLETPVANYTETMAKKTQELRKFLFKHFYLSETVHKHTLKGKELLKELFTRFYDDPKQLPKKKQELIDNPDPKAIVIKDYIAGMTDNFAKDTVLNLRKRLI